jgi:glycosyltransferase involved in cell wall biosynthesis
VVEGKSRVSGEGGVRVGFILQANDWLGGRIYLRNLLAAVRTLHDRTITPVIFAGVRQADASLDFPGTEIVAASQLDRASLAWLAWKVIAKTTSRDLVLGRLLRQHNLSLLSHSFHLGRLASLKTIGWIPDFQHLHLPEFFTPRERILRDRQFKSICADSDKIVVSSNCARNDLVSFAPEHAHKVELLRFVASPLPLHNTIALPELQRLYRFDSPYFLLPNQFWVHKNHRVVIAALQKLKQQHKKALVLATGSTEDYRNPTFFPSLMQYAAECDVLDSFRVIGKIPFDHLASLMQYAIAFINPSLFEGWSTSVEEAKSMGKLIVLSDIPVHREQAPERGLFFPPQDPDALAEALIAASNRFDIQQDALFQDQARELFPERQRRFGETYLAIVKRALNG